MDSDGFEEVGAVGLAAPMASAPSIFGFAGSAMGITSRAVSGATFGTTDVSFVRGHCDFDGDAIADVVLRGTFARERVGVVLGVRGGLASTPLFFSTTDGSSTSDATATDLNGDGRADLVIPAINAMQVLVYGGGPTGPSEGRVTRFSMPGTYAPPGLINPGDVDGDGFNDLVFIAASAGRMSLYLIRGGDPSPSVAANPFDNIVTASSSVLRPLD